jgi:hypothetical protein
MSWNMDDGRLACRWVESEEPEKYDVVLVALHWWFHCRSRLDSYTLRNFVNMLERI